MTYRPPDPRLASLADLLEDRLSPVEAAVVQQQITKGGARADHAVRWTKDFLSLAAAVPLHDPPQAVRERVLRSFEAFHGASAALAETPMDVTLALLFDSSRDLALAGTRSGDHDDSVVHLAYSSDEADLVLDISSTGPGRLRIEGQILPLGAGGAGGFESRLSLDGHEPRVASCDSYGRFSFEGASPGPQHLRAGNGHLNLVVDLDLREPWATGTTHTTPRSTPRSTEATRGAS